MRGVWIRGRRGDLVSASRRNNLSIPVRVWGPQRFAITNLQSAPLFNRIASLAFGPPFWHDRVRGVLKFRSRFLA